MTRERLDPSADAALLAYAEAHVFELPAAPHSWLFPRCAAVVHHGGAGTLAAGLRAGCPTVVCPFIFDQEYFGGLVEEQGCGAVVSAAADLTVAELAAAVAKVASDPEVRAAADRVGAALRAEDGVGATIAFIERAASSFPYPWPVEVAGFKRDEPAWTGEGEYKNFFGKSRLVDAHAE